MVQINARTPEQLRTYIDEQEKRGQHIPINIRVCFFKVGPLSYISHLDLVRTMTKIVVRSGLPLWYTEGFNPKPKLVFAAPLSTGVESEVEFMDIRLVEIIPEREVVEKLNRVMPPDMQVRYAYYPTKPLSTLGYLTYRIVVDSPDVTPELPTLISNALAAEKIEIEKKTKSAEKRLVDIKGQIRSVESDVEDGRLEMLATLSADPSAFLNPEYLVSYLKKNGLILQRVRLTEESYSIMRVAAYNADMTPFS